MYIPQDVVDLIIDQLVLTEKCPWELRWSLKATSLVSTAWVNPSQRHIFFAINFYNNPSVQRWCSRIKPDPYGLSRYVRVLRLWGVPLQSSSILETALPHLTSFQNLQELDIGREEHWDRIDINCTLLEVLAPIFSSFSGTLKRIRWTQKDTGQDTWKGLYVLTNLLSNLTDLDLSGVDEDYLTFSPPAFPCLRLSHHTEPPDPFAFKHFKFRELKIVGFTPLSSPFLEYCKTHLRVLDICAYGALGILGYVPRLPL